MTMSGAYPDWWVYECSNKHLTAIKRTNLINRRIKCRCGRMTTAEPVPYDDWQPE